MTMTAQMAAFRGGLPSAVLLTYPDACPDSLFQYHESFVQQATLFLSCGR